MKNHAEVISNNSLDAFVLLSFEYKNIQYDFKNKEDLKQFIIDKPDEMLALDDIIFYIISKNKIPSTHIIHKIIKASNTDNLVYLHNHFMLLFIVHLGLSFKCIDRQLSKLLKPE